MRQRNLKWLVLALLLAPVPSWAEDRAGTAAMVQGRVEVSRSGQWRPVWREDPIFVGDRVRTGADGKIQILFADESKMALGVNGNLQITKYIYSSRTGVFRLWMGRMRAVVSKNIDKGKSDYQFLTPTAVAGVRGTDLVLTVTPVNAEKPPETTAEQTPQEYKTELAVLEGEVGLNSSMGEISGQVIVTTGNVSEVAFGEKPTGLRSMTNQERQSYQRTSLAPGSGTGTQFAEDFGGGANSESNDGAGTQGDDILAEDNNTESGGSQGNQLPPIDQQPGSVGGNVPVSVEIRHAD